MQNTKIKVCKISTDVKPWVVYADALLHTLLLNCHLIFGCIRKHFGAFEMSFGSYSPFPPAGTEINPNMVNKGGAWPAHPNP